MPTMVFVSPKGGVGKTTSALLLACQLATGTDVTVIDADPNQPIKTWADGGHCPARLTVVSEVNERNIIAAIKDAATKTAFVIVDLEGTANKIVLLALSQADFAVIPLQGSQLDAEQASRAIVVIRESEDVTRRKLPFSVLLTRTSPAIRTRTMGHIQQMLSAAEIPVFQTAIHDREAYRAVFSFRRPLLSLDKGEVTGFDKAQRNVEEFALEVLRALSGEGAATTGETGEEAA